MEINLIQMPQGQTYEDRYQGYLRVFERIARLPSDEAVAVKSPPWSWVPLLRHLGCEIICPKFYFEHCSAVFGAFAEVLGLGRCDRTFVEVICNFRPETADALWKCDMQWKTKRAIKYKPVDEFIVTSNGAYHRPEVLEYMDALNAYQPTKPNVLLVPCAADKPYPSPLHQMCLDMFPDDSWYLMNATGVVGLVPEDLWAIMPHYDSGIPNQWRLFNAVRRYFARTEHKRIIVYCDFYLETIYRALDSIRQAPNATFPFAVYEYNDYMDLMAPDNVQRLKTAFIQPKMY